MNRPRRASIRLRLTLVYSGLFFLVALLLITAVYLLVRHVLVVQFHDANQAQLAGIKPLPANKPLLTDDGELVTVGDLRTRITATQQHVLNSTLRTLLGTALVATLSVGVLAVFAGWLVSGRLLGPLRTITRTAQDVAAGSLHERIRLAGPTDELRELADTFDTMLERLDRSFDSQRQFVANASHELRTPLAVTRALLQVSLGRPDASPDLREIGVKLLEVNDQQARLTDSLLTLAHTDQALTEVEAVDLAELAAGEVDRVRPAAEAAGVRLRVDLGGAGTVGDPVLLGQLAGNLLRNAVQYNVAGGWIEVGTGVEAGTAWLAVANTGAVMTEEEVQRALLPFHRIRAQPERHPRGVGLGLSIVRSIAHAHLGRLRAVPGPAGGLLIRVELPVSRPVPDSPPRP